MTAAPQNPTGEGFSPGNRVMKNTLWMTAASFGGRAISYVTFILLARFFTQTEVGVWAILLTASLFAEIVSNLGLDKILIRDAAKDREEGKALLASILTMKLIAGVVTGVIAYIFIFAGYPEISSAYPVALVVSFLAIPVIAVTRSLEAWHTAEEHLRYPAVAQMLERAALICVLLFVWLARCPFGYFIGLSALAPVMRFMAVFLPARDCVRLAVPRKIWPLLSESLILFAVEVMIGIYLRIDLIFVSKLESLAAAGLYNAAYRVFEFFTVIFSGYLLAIFPSLARKAHLRSFKNTFLLGLGVVSAAAAGGILFRDVIMGLFGPSYLEASTAFVMLMIALPLSYATSFLANSLIAMGKTRFLLFMALFVVGGNTLFNLLLIPRYSIAGAGLAFVLSEALSIAVLLYFSGFFSITRNDGAAASAVGAERSDGARTAADLRS